MGSSFALSSAEAEDNFILVNFPPKIFHFWVKIVSDVAMWGTQRRLTWLIGHFCYYRIVCIVGYHRLMLVMTFMDTGLPVQWSFSITKITTCTVNFPTLCEENYFYVPLKDFPNP